MDFLQRCRTAVPSLFRFATFGLVLTLIPLGIHISAPPDAGTVSSVIVGDEQSAAMRFAAVTPTPITTSEPQVPLAQPTLITEQTDAPPATVYTSIAATGDVMVSRRVLAEAQARRSYIWPFTQVSEVLSGADIAIVNLENPVMRECPPSASDMVFCMPSAALEGLTYAGIDIATVANNHTYDQGSVGYASTTDALNAAGILPSGSESLVIQQRGETTFGFIGYNRIRQSHDIPMMPTTDVIASIEAAAGQVDVLIVSFHWGVEFTSEPIVDQRDLAHAAVRAGADVIIGHHPHVLQTIEEYRGVPIFYSLGNFVFDNMSGTIPRTGWIAMLEFSDDRLMSYDVVTTMIHDFGQPRIVDATRIEDMP